MQPASTNINSGLLHSECLQIWPCMTTVCCFECLPTENKNESLAADVHHPSPLCMAFLSLWRRYTPFYEYVCYLLTFLFMK